MQPNLKPQASILNKSKRRKRISRVPYRRARTLYETIGVLPTASKEEILRARRFLLFRTHPDRKKHALARVHWECLDNTCTILLDDVNRRKYDYLLSKRMLPAHGHVRTDFNFIRRLLDETL